MSEIHFSIGGVWGLLLLVGFLYRYPFIFDQINPPKSPLGETEEAQRTNIRGKREVEG